MLKELLIEVVGYWVKYSPEDYRVNTVGWVRNNYGPELAHFKRKWYKGVG